LNGPSVRNRNVKTLPGVKGVGLDAGPASPAGDCAAAVATSAPIRNAQPTSDKPSEREIRVKRFPLMVVAPFLDRAGLPGALAT
jgi:hypothetical protein